MIRFRQTILVFIASFAIFPSAIYANCAVFATLDRVHYYQTLLQNQGTGFAPPSTIHYLNEQLTSLDNGLVLQAVATHPAADASEVFAKFIRNTRTLINMTITVSNRIIPLHFDSPSVQSNLLTVGDYLADLRCSGPVDQTSLRQAVGQDDGTRADAAIIRPDDQNWTHHTLTMLILGLLTIVAIARLIQTGLAHKRRMSQRHPCNYETVLRHGLRSEVGTMIDISMKGTKLRHMTHLDPGSRIEIRIFNHWHQGTIVWSNANYSGIVFRQSLRKFVMRRLRSAVAETAPVTQPG